MTPSVNDPRAAKSWFESHVSLGGKPYTLDAAQAQAVFDQHKNTLVTARAGSGKTRVIVAKVAYLVATRQAKLSEIAVFMFNRTAAAEVNERIGAVTIDGQSLKSLNFDREIKVASTFHKFALDTVKRSGESPELISENDHETLVKSSVRKVLAAEHRKIPPQEYAEILRLASSFIARAGQKYAGEQGLAELCHDVDAYIQQHQTDESYTQKIYLHKTCLAAYQEYLLALNFPQIDFNILMSRATRILQEGNSSIKTPHRPTHDTRILREGAESKKSLQTSLRPTGVNNNHQETKTNPALTKVSRLKYIMVDEYQDFSYLFFSIIQAMRQNCPAAHLFAVGDDWQAINRFAGSDVDYFINFAQYFPEDTVNIPLNTNYRSAKKIVENANRYMLKNYNPQASKAIPFSKQSGKIIRLNPTNTKFDQSDLYEDALGDARYLQALAATCANSDLSKNPANFTAAARLLKTVTKIVKRNRKQPIMLLHRHNFTSCLGVTLDSFLQALQIILSEQRIMTASEFSERIRGLTMHKSKGLESEIVILLEVNREQVLNTHPHATIFELFGDNLAAEKSDQHRLLYVAMTRAKQKLYILSTDKHPPI